MRPPAPAPPFQGVDGLVWICMLAGLMNLLGITRSAENDAWRASCRVMLVKPSLVKSDLPACWNHLILWVGEEQRARN